MQMKKADIKAFPKLHQYVSVALPEVQNVTGILKAIKKHSGTIDTKTIKKALVWGWGPMIKVVVMKVLGEFSPEASRTKFGFRKRWSKNSKPERVA